MSCEQWLKSYLGREAVLCEIVRSAAYGLGFSRKQLKSARANLGVKTFNRVDKDSNTNWFWYMPDAEG